MNYTKIYDDLINSRRAAGKNSGYCEIHHILPVCLGGTDEGKNLIKLTIKEHYIAHRLLNKMYPNHKGLQGAVSLVARRLNLKYLPKTEIPISLVWLENELQSKNKAQIAKELGVDATVIGSRIKKYNIPNPKTPKTSIAPYIDPIWLESELKTKSIPQVKRESGISDYFLRKVIKDNNIPNPEIEKAEEMDISFISNELETKNPAQVARELGVSEFEISNRIKKYNIPYSRINKLPDLDPIQVGEELKSTTILQLSRKLGVSDYFLRKFIREHRL